MAIAKMAKFIIVSHRADAPQLLEAMQKEGICQVLNADEAMVSRGSTELAASTDRPRDIEEFLNRLDGSIKFLSAYAPAKTGLTAALAPRAVVDEQSYADIVADDKLPAMVDRAQDCAAGIDRLKTRIDELQNTLDQLRPWKALTTPVEEISSLRQLAALAGMIPAQHFEQSRIAAGELGAVIEHVGLTAGKAACIVVCPKKALSDVQRLLRSAEFEPVSFEGLTGTVAELIDENAQALRKARDRLNSSRNTATELGRNLLKLEILCDHYRNLLNRENARAVAPATESTVILEGWVKRRNFKRLEKILSRFAASSLTEIEPAEGEDVPVDVENKRAVKPFEVITRLYGMPHHLNVDPTAFLMPFFAIFFGMCIADAGYGLLMIAMLLFFIKKMQGDKSLLIMLAICGLATVVVGALTGGWFGNAIAKFVTPLSPVRDRLMWFDPFKNPLLFFGLALGLGYFQLQTGLVIALVHNLRRKDYVSAAFDQGTWLVMLNSIVLFGAAKTGTIPSQLSGIFGFMAIVPAALIFLLSHREGGWGGRLGMGFYNLFSTVFYLGDVLSYLRLMALGMVGAGLAMAINVIADISKTIPYIGLVVAALIFVGGHVFNMLLAVLSAFVHTLRLQYVEFFPKFLIGGGTEFRPLSKEYRHIYMKNS